MIIVRVIGGLGNQMFQYAMGRRLSLKNNVELKLDISAFISFYKLHSYNLDKFTILENIATPEEIGLFVKLGKLGKFHKMLYNLDVVTPYYKRKYIKERSMLFDSNILKIKDNVYLDGYWASEKYFNDIELELRKDFTLKEELDEKNIFISNEILDTESVSIHIRRGDYITDPQTNKIHGTCSLDYYYSAIDDICKYVSDPQFYVFSDDPEWVRQNLTIPYPMKLVTGNGVEKNYCDLRLMSLCKHHIIANSSFSWWGAWLSNNKNKRVYSPKRWYNVNYDTKDLLPESWHKI
jgi:hypothetical protein